MSLHDSLTVDIETTGLKFWKDAIIGVAVKFGEEKWYFPFKHLNTDNLTEEQLKMLCNVLSEAKLLRNWNIKFDLLFLRRYMKRVPPVEDGMFGMYLFNENLPRSLKTASDNYLGTNSSQSSAELDKLLNTWGYGKGEMWRLPAHYITSYACDDVELADRMIKFLRNKLTAEVQCCWEDMNELSNNVLNMEYEGVLIDKDLLVKYEAEANLACELIQRNLRARFPGLNPASPASITKQFRLKDSTYETLLLYKQVEGVTDILQFRDWSKAANTYYAKYRREHLDVNSRLHTNFNITGTVNGRFSSKDPNLQAVPRKSSEQKVKDLFVAEPGTVFCEADYSQAEIRIGAHYTKEQVLIDTLCEGKDIHQAVADEVGIDRSTAKTVNFLTIYGGGAKVLAEKLGIGVAKAGQILDKFHKTYPKFRLVSKAAETVASTRGHVCMWNGRRRHYDQLNSEPHTAFNSLIQGGVGQMVIRAMNRIAREVPEFKMRLQVHDSIAGYVEKRIHKDVIHAVKEIMEDQPEFCLPMKADFKVGNSWGTTEDFK
jgi:DNA polymerase-1